jgi:hypothetical protein
MKKKRCVIERRKLEQWAEEKLVGSNAVKTSNKTRTTETGEAWGLRKQCSQEAQKTQSHLSK